MPKKDSTAKGEPYAVGEVRLRIKLLTVFISVVIALIICEIAIRLFDQAPEIIPIGVSSDKHVYRRSTNPILSYEFKPGFRSKADDLTFDYRVINSHGLRDVERKYPKSVGTKRILLLGDSVVVGYGIKEINQLMSRQLEKLYGKEKVEVLNVAVTGYCTRTEVELLRVQGVKYDPDAVIMVFVENDFRNFNPESIGADGVADRPAAASWMFRKSHLFRLACLNLNWFSFGLETDPASWNQKAIGDNNVVEGLKLLRELADEHGFKPLVAVWPAFVHDRIEYPDKMFMPDSEELIVERLAGSYDLPVVGLREAFDDHWKQQNPRPVPREYYSVGDEMHPSINGHRVTAEILRSIVEEHDLLKPAERRTTRPLSIAQDDAAARQAAQALGTEKAGYGLVYFNRAVALYKGGKLDAAVEQLENVNAADLHNYGPASVIIAQIYSDQGMVDKAKSRLQKAIELNPDHFQAHMLLAMLWKDEHAYERAIEHLQRAVKVSPNTYDGHYHLGHTFAQRRRWKEAEPHLRAAVRLKPEDASATSLLATCLRAIESE